MPFDPGLQPERTELAWRRTAISLSIGSLVALRLLPATLGDASWALVGIGGLLGGSTMWLIGRRRARRVQEALAARPGTRRLPGGGALAALSGLIAASGVVATLAVIAVAFRW